MRKFCGIWKKLHYPSWRRKNLFLTDCYIFFSVIKDKLKYGWSYNEEEDIAEKDIID